MQFSTIRRLPAIFIFSALFAALFILPASAQTQTSVRLRIDGKESALYTMPFFDGKEVYLPMEALRLLGADFSLGSAPETALIRIKTNPRYSVKLIKHGLVDMIPISSLLTALKARALVANSICDVYITTRPEDRKVQPSHVQSTASAVNGPSIKTASVVPTSSGSNTRTTTIQKPDIVEQHSSAQTANKAQGPVKPDDKITIEPTALQGAPAENISASPQTAVMTPGTELTSVQFEVEDEHHARLRIKYTGVKPRYNIDINMDPLRMDIVFNAATSIVDPIEQNVDHPFLTGIKTEPGEATDTTRISLSLKQALSNRVQENRGEIVIFLGLPRGAGRKMNQTLIVVDPGHGGSSSTGCSARVGGSVVYEKSLTLSIGKRLYDALKNAGANVLMTRTDDSDVSLNARPELATNRGADLFVSIHIDDCAGINRASGTTAYYHMQDTSSRALAQCLVSSVASVSGLPKRGALSDGVLYHSGLAVLRHSTTPAVLVEVGYINNSKDRAKILNEEFQKTVAKALSDGICKYVEGETNTGSATTEGAKSR